MRVPAASCIVSVTVPGGRDQMQLRTGMTGRRAILAVLLGLLIVIVLQLGTTACGGDDDDDASRAAGDGTVASSPNDAEEGSEEPEGNADVPEGAPRPEDPDF